MEQKNISFNYGISRSPSISNDGELSECVNLIPKKGELVPLNRPHQFATLNEGEELLWIHETNDFTHYILKSGAKIGYRKNNGGPEGSVYLSDFVEIGTYDSTMTTITSIGNTLIVSSGKGITYSLFSKEKGKYLGLGGIPKLNNTIAFTMGERVGYRYPDDEEFDKVRESHIYDVYSNEGNINNSHIKSLTKIYNTAIAQQNRDQVFSRPFFVVAAYRLYDGTHVGTTSPIYMCPSTFGQTFTATTGRTPTTDNLTTATEYKFATKVYDLYMSMSNVPSEAWKDVIVGIDIYASPQLDFLRRDDDGDLALNKTQKDGYTTYGDYYLRKDAAGFEERNTYANGSGVTLNVALNRMAENEMPDVMLQYGSSFFLLQQIDFGDIAKYKNDYQDYWKRVTLDTGWNLLDLAVREAFDSKDLKKYYADQFTCNGAHVYNARLNMYDITYYNHSDMSVGSLIASGEYPESGEYECVLYIKNASGDWLECDNSYRIHEDYLGYLRYIFIPDTDISEACLYYPATHKSYRYTLIPHPFLEGSYHFAPMTNYRTGEILTMNGNSSFPDIKERNKILTTSANNPFVILHENLVGNDAILGVATSTKAISIGQFGDAPLYAFSGDGIWSFGVGSDGTFVTRQPVSRDVCINPISITQIDDAVVYVSGQGLKMLVGGDSVLLSGAMDGENVDESKFLTAEEWKDYVIKDTNLFRDMLKEARIVFDNSHRLLHVYPKSGTKHWVYSMDDGVWSSMVDHELKAYATGWPENVIQIDNGLYDYRAKGDYGYSRGIALTRRMFIDNPFAMKTLHDLRLMKKITNPKFGTVKVAVYGSNDDVNWVQIQSLKIRPFKFYRFAFYTYLATSTDALSGMSIRYDFRRTNKLR